MIIDASSFLRKAAWLASLAGLFWAGGAQAQSCQDDFQKLSQRRMSQIQVLNSLGKAGKGKMDPMAACPASRKLAAIEAEMLGYMEKNKEWCSIPDNVLDGFKQARAKTLQFSGQACAFAAKAKKMQETQRQQAAQGGGMMAPPKLPSGPL